MEAKTKVLSIRVREDIGELLRNKAENEERMKISRYVRRLIKDDLGIEVGNKKLIKVDLDLIDYEMLQRKARTARETPLIYVKKLVKADLMGKRNIQPSLEISPEPSTQSDKLQEEHEKLKKSHENISKKNKRLGREKTQLLEDIKFLMDFFQMNAQVLQENSAEYLAKNGQKFGAIAEKLKELT